MGLNCPKLEGFSTLGMKEEFTAFGIVPSLKKTVNRTHKILFYDFPTRCVEDSGEAIRL